MLLFCTLNGVKYIDLVIFESMKNIFVHFNTCKMGMMSKKFYLHECNNSTRTVLLVFYSRFEEIFSAQRFLSYCSFYPLIVAELQLGFNNLYTKIASIGECSLVPWKIPNDTVSYAVERVSVCIDGQMYVLIALE